MTCPRSAWWRGGWDTAGESIRLSEEAFNRLIAENQPQKAAMKAAEVALQWLNGGDWTITRSGSIVPAG